MKFPRIEVGYNIVFNNTGFDWTEIQNALCEIVERKYRVLHCITAKYHEENNIGAVRYEIKGVWCLFYFKVNINSLTLDVIAIKEDNRVVADAEENKAEDAMTDYIKRQDAIEAIKKYALKAYDIDLNDVEQFAGSSAEERFCEGLYEATEVLEEVPKADVVEIVRCSECGSYNKRYEECTKYGSHLGENGFCSRGTRAPQKEGE